MAGKSKKSGKVARVSAGVIPKLSLSMPLDEKKIKAIQKCIEKGTLEVTLTKVDLTAGTIAEPYIYD